MSEMVGGDARLPPPGQQRQQQFSVSSTHHQQAAPNYHDIMERFGGGGAGGHSRSIRSDLSRTLHIPGIGKFLLVYEMPLRIPCLFYI